MKRFKRDTPAGEGVEAAVLFRKAVGDLTELTDKSPVYSPLRKSAELQYTLGPVYSPMVLDAHDEFTDSEELRKALWEFELEGDKLLRKQHGTEKIGRIVELVQWPYEVNTQMVVPGTEALKKVKFPADTVYMGTVWSDDAWPLVKSGQIAGYSMGGTTFRVRDAMDSPALAKLS